MDNIHIGLIVVIFIESAFLLGIMLNLESKIDIDKLGPLVCANRGLSYAGQYKYTCMNNDCTGPNINLTWQCMNITYIDRDSINWSVTT